MILACEIRDGGDIRIKVEVQVLNLVIGSLETNNRVFTLPESSCILINALLISLLKHSFSVFNLNSLLLLLTYNHSHIFFVSSSDNIVNFKLLTFISKYSKTEFIVIIYLQS